MGHIQFGKAGACGRHKTRGNIHYMSVYKQQTQAPEPSPLAVKYLLCDTALDRVHCMTGVESRNYITISCFFL